MEFKLQRKLFMATLFITAKFFTTSILFAQMYHFSLDLNSLQQKFSLTSNYLGTNSVVERGLTTIQEMAFRVAKLLLHSLPPSVIC